MKLRVPFLCVALLSVGIMPVAAAGPRSFSEDAKSDSAEGAPAIAPDPSSVNPSKENDRTQWWAIPSVIPSQKPIAEKPSSQSEELEAKVSVENQVQKLNSDLIVASEYKRNIKKTPSEAGRMPAPQGVLKISSNSDRAFPNPNIEPITDIPKLNDIDRPSTSVEGLLEQSRQSFIISDAVRISQSVVQVTGVKLNPTAAGLEVILETEAGQLLQAITRTEGNSAIADIENAQLVLPSGEEFRVQNPDRGIAEVTVTQLEGSRIRVTVTGEQAAPPAQVVESDRGLVLSVTPPVNSEQLEIVVTATRTAEVIQNIPRSVTVVTRAEVEQQTPVSRSLQDIVGREVPGLGASTQSRNQFGQNLRGRSVSVLIDGVPLTTNTQPRGLQTIAPNAVERIEVIRGPNAIYGSQATGGTINIITRRPSENPLSQQSEVGLTAAGGGQRFLESDSVGNYIAHALSGTLGAYNYVFSFSRESTGTFYDAEGDRIFNDRPLDQSNTYNILAKAGVNLDSQQRLQLTFNRYSSTQVDNEYINDLSVNTRPAGTEKARALRVGELEFIDSTPPRDQTTLLNFTYTNDQLFGSQLQAQAYYRYSTLNFFPGDFREAFFENITFGQVENQNWGGRLQIETPLFTVAKVVWGVDYNSEYNTVVQDIFDPATFDESGGRVYRKIDERVEIPRYDLNQLGLFAQFQWDVSDNFLVTGGLRHQRVGFSVDDYTTFPGNAAIEGGDLDFNNTVFNAGAVYKITDTFNVFGNFAQGFSIPDFGNLLRRPPAGFSIGGDFQQLEAVRVDNYEIGVRGNWEQVNASISGFYNTSELGESFELDDRGFPIGINRAPQRIYGVEGTLDWRPGGGWQLGGTATWQEGENDVNQDGDYLPLNSSIISPLKLTSYIQHQTTPGWRNRLQLAYIGNRDRAFDKGVDPVGIDNYLVVDYISSVKVGPGTLNIGIENLLDTQYFPVQLQRAGGFDNSERFAARGRSLSLRYVLNW
ncbi:TonB-dependent receptor domain-containing protein [Microcoleus sp. AT3-D2]|uniref:TonB-dependent receptor domain-containing protein n=1 Tax=Microcoleus sp. AT3-D2 TaxID=2818612 RepID=UPI002FD2F46C